MATANKFQTIKKDVYNRKTELIEAIETLDKQPALLIDFLNPEGYHKYIHFKTHRELFINTKNFEQNGNYCIFELVRETAERKPYLDIELKFPNEKTCNEKRKEVITKIIKYTIKIFKTQYGETIQKGDIKLLNSSGNVDGGYKMSFHVIVSPKDRTLYYKNSKYTDSSAFHYYSSLINMDESCKEYADSQVYNNEFTFRIIGSAKTHSDLRILKPIDVETFEEIGVTEQEKLDYMLTYIRKNKTELKTPVIEQASRPKKYISGNSPTTTAISDGLLKMVRKLHPSAVHHGLRNNTYHNFNYTNRKEKCPISGLIHDGSNGFYVFETPRGYYMKCHSDKCKGSKHIGHIEMSSEIINNAIQIDKRYIIEKDTLDNDNVGKHIIDWMENDTRKVLVTKSAMGTGKTTMIKKILDKYTHLKKILWITHRQTLTKQLYGQFKDYGFSNYMNVDNDLFEYNRIIVQVDSLMKIMSYDEEGNIIIKMYDLVIIDEIEGNLNHYSSPFLEKDGGTSRSTFDFMFARLMNANKVLLLDADVGARTCALVKSIGTYVVINNTYKPITKKYIVTNDKKSFNKCIFDDIENKKKVCIVSMTASYIEKIAAVLATKKIKYMMHTSRVDDKFKSYLEDVNKHWKDYQVILYSPCIESGVDFNVKHFDKIYGVIKNGPLTCSQRAFLQMMGRIRIVESPVIQCLYSGPSHTNNPIYTFDDVLSYARYYESINGKKIIHNATYKEVIEGSVIKYKRDTTNISLFDIINIHNEVEQLNKNHMIFMTVLNKLIQISGHELTFNIIEDPKGGKIGGNVESLKERIIAIDEREYNFDMLLKKQSRNDLDEEEKLAIKKIFLIKTFGIKCTDDRETLENFLKQFYDDEIKFKRFEDFFGYKEMSDKDDYDNLPIAKKKVRHKIIVDILNRFLEKNNTKYESDELVDIEMYGDKYGKGMLDIANNSLYFKEEEKSRPLFFKNKGKFLPANQKNKQHYSKTVMALLDHFGIKLEMIGRVRIDGERTCKYSLSVDGQIKDIIDLKYGTGANIEVYSSLF